MPTIAVSSRRPTASVGIMDSSPPRATATSLSARWTVMISERQRPYLFSLSLVSSRYELCRSNPTKVTAPDNSVFYPCHEQPKNSVFCGGDHIVYCCDHA